MEPFEFVSLTPKTNCGECGHPTCLAFAVAVTKGGVDFSRCPYLDRSRLDTDTKAQTVGGSLDDVAQGREQRDLALVTHLKSKIADLNFQDLAPLLGAQCPSQCDELNFSYLGRSVRLGKGGISLSGENLTDPRDQILLYNYIAFQGGPSPDGTWVGMESLPNSISKIRTLETYCEQRLADTFRSRPARLLELCIRIGGRVEPSGHSASVCVTVPALPMVPLMVLFWDEEPEDGFDSKVKILFDHHVLEFLDLESLVFTAERMADHLMELDR